MESKLLWNNEEATDVKEQEGKNKRNQMVDTLMKNEYVIHNCPLGRNRNVVALKRI